MINSQWFAKEERELNAFRSSKRKQFPALVIMIILMGAFFVFMTLKNGTGDMEVSTSQVVMPIVALMVICIGVLLLANRKNYKVGNPELAKYLEKLLRTPEEVQWFDEEIEAPALWSLKKGKQYQLFITKHFLVCIERTHPLKRYTFVKLSDIRSIECLKFGRFHINFYGDNQQELDCISLESKKDYQAFVAALKNFLPNVDIKMEK